MIDISSYSPTVQILALSEYCDVNPRMFEALLAKFNTLESILLADSSALMEVEGMTPEVAQTIELAPERLAEAAVFEEALKAREIHLTHRLAESYPRLLLELNDPPPLLYFKGIEPSADTRSVTVVGARSSTPDGLQVTSSLVRELVRNDVRIVSSLTPGADSTALQACIGADGVAIGTLDSGLDMVVGELDLRLANEVARKGTILTEYAPETEPDEETLKQADRLLVGLSHAVVVTEAYEESSRVLDILGFCRDIGKLAFFMIEPDYGALADEASLAQALNCGAIPLQGFDNIDDIVKSLV